MQGNENKMYKLKIVLYGLKQALRAWYGRLYAYLYENLFQISENEPNIYIKKKEND